MTEYEGQLALLDLTIYEVDIPLISNHKGVFIGNSGLHFLVKSPNTWDMYYETYGLVALNYDVKTRMKHAVIFCAAFAAFIERIRTSEYSKPDYIRGKVREGMHNLLASAFNIPNHERIYSYRKFIVGNLYSYTMNVGLILDSPEVIARIQRFGDRAISRGYKIRPVY